MTTLDILKRARAAAGSLGVLSTEAKNAAIGAMASELEASAPAVLAANEIDMAAAKGHISDVMLDRLRLTEARLASMAAGMRQVMALPDPAWRTLESVTRPDGLRIDKVSVPLGVIAIIYESRPNVTSDAAVLAFKSGNVCVLRSGKEAWRSAEAVVKALRWGLAKAGLDENYVNLIEDTTRNSANELMTAIL